MLQVRTLWITYITNIEVNFFLIKPTDTLIFPNLFLSRNSTCFGAVPVPIIRSVPCTFGTGICRADLMTAVIKTALHTSAECTRKTPDDGQRNCPKHVEFLDKNKFAKISASVGFI
jgi:hypothetical protein